MFGGWAMPVWYKHWRYPIMVIQIFLAALIQVQGMPHRINSRLHHHLARAACAVLCFFAVALEYHDGNFYCNYMVINFTMYLVVLLSILTLYKVSFATASLAAANSYLMQEMAGSFKTMLRLVFPVLVDVAYDPVGVLFMDALSYGLFYLIGYILLRKTIRQTDYLQEHYKAVAAILALLICIGMSAMTRGHDITAQTIVPSLADNMYLIGSGALLFALQIGLSSELKALRDVDAMKEVIREQSIQYEAGKENVQLLNEKYHDLKQMIGALRGKISEEELEQLDKSVSAYGADIHTGNEILDVLLTQKRIFCEKNGIHITTMVNSTDLSFMDTLDVYSLLSNALTNAIEAVARLPEGQERFVSLSVSRSGQMILFHIENPYEGELVFKDGLPVTPRDKSYHGFGMKSMERVTDKYGGSLIAGQRDGMFTLDILLVDPRQS